MKLFREKRVFAFEEKDVELYEMSVETLVKIQNKEYKDFSEVIADNSNLSLEEVKNLSAEAEIVIQKAFFEINGKYFEGEKGGEIDKKKF